MLSGISAGKCTLTYTAFDIDGVAVAVEGASHIFVTAGVIVSLDPI